MIKIQIDWDKVDKSRLYQGKKGTYLNAFLKDTPDNQYGNDYMIVQEVSYDEYQAGKRGEIIGNGKILVKKPNDPPIDEIPTDGDMNDLGF